MTDNEIRALWKGHTALSIERDQTNQQTHLWTDLKGEHHSTVRAWKSLPLEPTEDQVRVALFALGNDLESAPPPPHVVKVPARG